ncbi:hypothetical protein WJ438_16665 [Streptomyces sp. GD-15H]|uniref:hypothetical protein n=1 Tax=Streptomyces sp. GD-15H TaxID=3129112 RepID=UPI003245080D
MRSLAVPGDGQGNSRLVTDAELHVSAELFPQALGEGLKGFFERALHRDVEQRYDSPRQVQEAWRQVFRRADAAPPATAPATVGIGAEDLEDAREQAAEEPTSVSNEFSGGDSDAVVQAGTVHGGVHVHGPDRSLPRPANSPRR